MKTENKTKNITKTESNIKSALKFSVIDSPGCKKKATCICMHLCTKQQEKGKVLKTSIYNLAIHR